MHKEYILLNGFRKAKKGFTAGFHVPLNSLKHTVKMRTDRKKIACVFFFRGTQTVIGDFQPST